MAANTSENGNVGCTEDKAKRVELGKLREGVQGAQVDLHAPTIGSKLHEKIRPWNAPQLPVNARNPPVNARKPPINARGPINAQNLPNNAQKRPNSAPQRGTKQYKNT